MGVLHEIQGVLASDFSLVAVSEKDLEFDTKVELLPNLRAPIDRGDKVGELVILRDKEEFLPPGYCRPPKHRPGLLAAAYL